MKGSRGTDDINRHEESPDGAELPSEMSLDSIVWTRDRAFSPGFVAVCVYADTHLHMGSANGGRGGARPELHSTLSLRTAGQERAREKTEEVVLRKPSSC